MGHILKDRRTPRDRRGHTVKEQMRFNQIAIAFQPIVDVRSRQVWGYEALTRGADGQIYPQLIAGLSDEERKTFDKVASAKAVQAAAKLGLIRNGPKLTLNVRPTLEAGAADARFIARVAKHYNIVAASAILLELTEDAKLTCDEFIQLMEVHRSLGLATGIDDFGSGYSGLNMLATCGAEVVKLDLQLVKGIDNDPKRQSIVESFTRLCKKLGSMGIGEGVETREEAVTLRELGITMMQGYYFGRAAVGIPRVLRLGVDEEERERYWTAPFKTGTRPCVYAQ